MVPKNKTTLLRILERQVSNYKPKIGKSERENLMKKIGRFRFKLSSLRIRSYQAQFDVPMINRLYLKNNLLLS